MPLTIALQIIALPALLCAGWFYFYTVQKEKMSILAGYFELGLLAIFSISYFALVEMPNFPPKVAVDWLAVGILILALSRIRCVMPRISKKAITIKYLKFSLSVSYSLVFMAIAWPIISRNFFHVETFQIALLSLIAGVGFYYGMQLAIANRELKMVTNGAHSSLVNLDESSRLRRLTLIRLSGLFIFSLLTTIVIIFSKSLLLGFVTAIVVTILGLLVFVASSRQVLFKLVKQDHKCVERYQNSRLFQSLVPDHYFNALFAASNFNLFSSLLIVLAYIAWLYASLPFLLALSLTFSLLMLSIKTKFNRFDFSFLVLVFLSCLAWLVSVLLKPSGYY